MNNDAQNNSERTKMLKQCWKALKLFATKMQFSFSNNHIDPNMIEENAFNDQGFIDSMENEKQVEHTSLKDWIKSTDSLILLVQAIRKRIQYTQNQTSDMDTLSASAYLYHLDRLLVIIRENFLTLRYRQEQFSNKNEILSRVEFFQANQACSICYSCIVYLTDLMKKLSKNDINSLYSEEFVRRIHELEMESNALSGAIRTLNHFAYRQEAVAQLSKLEQDLFETFVYSRSLELSNTRALYNNFTMHPSAELNGGAGYLKSKSHKIFRQEDFKLVNSIIDIYDILRKCYVVARKSIIKETLEIMAQNIEALTLQFEQEDYNKEKIVLHLHQIFNSVESLRFSSNRESRCSRHLFEKAKAAKRELRKACLAHPIGNEFLKEINIPQGIFSKSLSK